MQLICPHCQHAVDYSTERPRFCSHCGQALAGSVAGPGETTADAPSAVDDRTRVFQPGADTQPPANGRGAYTVPDRIGGYRLGKRLGGGGMGSVYEASHVATGQRAAVKLINAAALSATAIERFRQEGKLASTIAHPRCVFVLAADEEAGQPYIVMELMPGQTLADLVAERGPLTPKEAITRALDVIDGLREAHRLGVIHRDVKPSNCFLDADGRVKVGDFGLAKSQTEDESHLTRTGGFVGTVLFASPEQLRRQPLDVQADVYSVAATLYFLLTGKAPFADVDVLAATARIVTEDPPPMRSLRPELPEGLDRVVLRGLARDKSDRWADLEQFRAALVPFLPGQLTAGGLGYRFGAFLVDTLIILAVLTPVRLALNVEDVAEYTRNMLSHLLRDLGISFVVWMAYFGLFESLLGWTPGKWVFRLRVAGPSGVDRPGLPRGLGRAAVFFLFRHLDNVLVVLTMVALQATIDLANPLNPVVAVIGAVQLAGTLLGIGLPLASMRKRNGYRLLHEFASGTRVVQLPEAVERPTFEQVQYTPPLLRPEGLPEQIGPFAVRGAWRWTADDRTLLGEDPGLGRTVLIWLRPATEPALTAQRRDIARGTRVRWVACGEGPDWRWDAFLTPAGSPVEDVVAQTGRLTWAEALPVLDQLTGELAASCREGTTPGTLSPHQVWVDAHGRVQLLGDSILGLDPATRIAGDPDPERRSLHLLAEVSAIALEGRPRVGRRGPLRAPLPRYVAAVLNRLHGVGPPFVTVAEFRAALRGLRGRPVTVSRQRRLVHLVAVLCLGLAAAAGPLAGLVVGPVVVPQQHLQLAEGRDRQLRMESQAQLAAGIAQPEAWSRLAAPAQYEDDARLLAAHGRWLGELRHYSADRLRFANPVFRRLYRQQQTAVQSTAGLIRTPDVREAVRTDLRGDSTRFITRLDRLGGMLAVVPALWCAWAFLTRGGLSFRYCDIELVRSDGGRPGRFRCLLRAVVFWLPLVAAAGLSICLDYEYWSHWADPALRGRLWMPWAARVLSWTAAGLLLGYLALALWRPERSWHDRLAGTWLVPR